MKPLQILSLIFAIILLLPGLCFLGFGAAFTFGGGGGGGGELDFSRTGPSLLLIAFVILGLVGLLGYFAFMKASPPSAPSPTPIDEGKSDVAPPPDDRAP